MKLKLMSLLILAAFFVNSFAIKRKASEISVEVPEEFITILTVDNKTEASVLGYVEDNRRHDLVFPRGTTVANIPLRFNTINTHIKRSVPLYFYPEITEEYILNENLILWVQKNQQVNPHNPNRKNITLDVNLFKVDVSQDPAMVLNPISVAHKVYSLDIGKQLTCNIRILFDGEDLENSEVQLYCQH
jgi:hypothetical protein